MASEMVGTLVVPAVPYWVVAAVAVGTGAAECPADPAQSGDLIKDATVFRRTQNSTAFLLLSFLQLALPNVPAPSRAFAFIKPLLLSGITGNCS